MKQLFVIIIILLGCESQAAKDREKMITLISNKEKLEDRLTDLRRVMKSKTYPIELVLHDSLRIISSLDNTPHTENMKQSLIKNKYSQILAITVKYDFEVNRVNDSIRDIDKQIENLSLLMGK